VVTVPVVGWVPLHPPDAAQVCASFALQRNVAGVPLVMLLFVATSVTAGFAALLLAAGSESVVWLEDDCPQAANAENAAHPKIPRNRREAAAQRRVNRTLLMNLVSRPDVNENSDLRLGLRSTLFIGYFPCDLGWRRLPRVAQRRIVKISQAG
jgi:hypothetical protein